MINEEHITQLVKKHLEGTDKFLVAVKIKPGNRILIFIDSDTSVSIDDCASLNRFIESKFDREIEDFEIKVSSAGLDQPIILLRQYKKNIGRQVEIVTIDGQKKKGILLKAEKEMIELEIKNEEKNKAKSKDESVVAVAFADIKETKQVVSFK